MFRDATPYGCLTLSTRVLLVTLVGVLMTGIPVT